MYQAGDSITTGRLYRRIFPNHSWFQSGEPTSLVFKPKPNAPGISAYLAELTSPENVLAGHSNFGLVEISVEEVIQEGFSVIYDPGEGPAHVTIKDKFKAGKCRALSKKSNVLKAPEIL